MLTIWGRRTSSNVQAVMWCIAELGIEHHRIDAGHVYGVVDTPEYRAMNPNGTVPTIRDNDSPPQFESGAILRYLAGRYAPDAFWPQDPVARAQVDMWAEWSKLNIALNLTVPIFWRVVRTAPSMRDPQAIAEAIVKLEHYLGIADARLGQMLFLTANHLTLADIQFGHVLYRYYEMDIKRGHFPHVRRYYERLCALPTYAENVMVPYDELRVFD